MTGVAIILFLVLVPLSGLVIYTRQPRLQTTHTARRPAPVRTSNHTARAPVAPQRPAQQAVVAPVRTLRRLHNPRVVYQRRLRAIEAGHTAAVLTLERRVAELEAKLLEQLVLGDVL